MKPLHTSLAITCLALVSCAAVGTGSAAAAGERAFELVSPADTSGNDVQEFVQLGTPRLPRSASSDGNAFGFINLTGGLLTGEENGSANLYRSARTDAGWQTRYVGPPASIDGQFFPVAASDDLRTMLVQQQFGEQLDPADPDPGSDPSVSEFRLFTTTDGAGFNRVDRGSAMEPGTPGQTLNNSSPLAFDAETGGTVFATNRRMEPEPNGTDPALNRIYRRLHGRTELVSVDGEGTPIPGTVSASPASDDLRTVYFDGGQSPFEDVYLWRDGEAHLVTTSRRDSPDPVDTGARVQDVSSDGRSVILRTRRALTNDDELDTESSVASPRSGFDLYEFRLPESGDPSEAALTRITGSTAGTSSRLVSASRDHTRVYFSSDADLDGPAGPAASGALNLYYRERGDAPILVAALPDTDKEIPFEPNSDTVSFPGQPSILEESPSESNRGTRVTENGRVLLFRSRGAFDGAPGGTINVFRWDATTRAITCASCGVSSTAADALLVGRGVGRNVTADGSKVFFQTTGALVPGDTNGKSDVYEYDASADEAQLVSTGTAPSGAVYFDNSADGRDVFFGSREALVPQDRNGDEEALRIYDARVGGGFPAQNVQPPCVGDGCRALIERPAASVPGGSTIPGPGDPVVPRAPEASSSPVLKVGRVSAAQARTFARTGRMTLSVRGLRGRTVIRGRVDELRGTRRVRLATGSRTIKSSSSARLTVRASRSGRKRLRSGQRLRLRFTVSRSGSARAVTSTAVVPATRSGR